MQEMESDADIESVLEKVFLWTKLKGLQVAANHARQLAFSLDKEPDQIVDMPAFRECGDQMILIRLAWTIANVEKQFPPRALRRHRRTIARALDYIEEYAATPIDLFALAQHSGASYRTLARLFQAEFGSTIYGYIVKHRLSLARQVLERREPAGSIREIAAAAGFSHMGGFSKAYKQSYGETPSDTLARARSTGPIARSRRTPAG